MLDLYSDKTIELASQAKRDFIDKEEFKTYDTTDVLKAMVTKFSLTRRSQTVSFRSLVHWMKVGERATHYIHPYPAKLLPQIAHFFLAAKGFFGENIHVLDPFGGTGTVALETLLSGNTPYFSDANPIARLIAKVKTKKLSPVRLNFELENIIGRYKKTRPRKAPDVINLEHWYTPETIRGLTRLRTAIESIENTDIRDFFWVTFSAVSRKVSLADPRLSVPVKRKDYHTTKDISVLDTFIQQANSNISRMLELNKRHTKKTTAKCVGFDARSLKEPKKWNNESKAPLLAESIDLIITSPPYAGAQKYIRASSLNLGWLNLAESKDLKPLENLSIGREHLAKEIWDSKLLTNIKSADKILKKIREINPLRAAIAATYLNEMNDSIKEMSRVLKKGGHLVLVIGNNEVCGEVFASSEYLVQIAKNHKLNPILKMIDEIKSRGLMTKRNKTAGIISREWVIVFKKNK